VNNADVICRTSLFGLELGMRLWIALDSIETFGFTDRLRALWQGTIPEEVRKRATELLSETEAQSRFKKMITPGKVVWLVHRDSKIIVSCPESLVVTTQPMFVGTNWLRDHSLISYRAALESV
jgi:hypothetical protein